MLPLLLSVGAIANRLELVVVVSLTRLVTMLVVVVVVLELVSSSRSEDL